MDEIKAQELFDFFNQEGYDLGDFNNFTSALTDDVKREKLYSFFNEEGYDVGSIDNFTLKKKDDSDFTSQEDVTESITPDVQEEVISSDASFQRDDSITENDYLIGLSNGSIKTNEGSVATISEVIAAATEQGYSQDEIESMMIASSSNPTNTEVQKVVKPTNTEVQKVAKPNWQKQIDELGGSASIWNDPSAKGVSNEEINAYYLASQEVNKESQSVPTDLTTDIVDDTVPIDSKLTTPNKEVVDETIVEQNPTPTELDQQIYQGIYGRAIEQGDTSVPTIEEWLTNKGLSAASTEDANKEALEMISLAAKNVEHAYDESFVPDVIRSVGASSNPALQQIQLSKKIAKIYTDENLTDKQKKEKVDNLSVFDAVYASEPLINITGYTPEETNEFAVSVMSTLLDFAATPSVGIGSGIVKLAGKVLPSKTFLGIGKTTYDTLRGLGLGKQPAINIIKKQLPQFAKRLDAAGTQFGVFDVAKDFQQQVDQYGGINEVDFTQSPEAFAKGYGLGAGLGLVGELGRAIPRLGTALKTEGRAAVANKGVPQVLTDRGLSNSRIIGTAGETIGLGGEVVTFGLINATTPTEANPEGELTAESFKEGVGEAFKYIFAFRGVGLAKKIAAGQSVFNKQYSEFNKAEKEKAWSLMTEINKKIKSGEVSPKEAQEYLDGVVLRGDAPITLIEKVVQEISGMKSNITRDQLFNKVFDIKAQAKTDGSYEVNTFSKDGLWLGSLEVAGPAEVSQFIEAFKKERALQINKAANGEGNYPLSNRVNYSINPLPLLEAPTTTVDGDDVATTTETTQEPIDNTKEVKTIKELGEENKSTYPKVKTDNVFLNEKETLSREERKGVDEVIENEKVSELPSESISIEKIVPTQTNLTIKNLEETKDLDGVSVEESILVKEKDGKFYIVDGHHRLANYILKGNTNVEVKVYRDTETTQEVQESDVSPEVEVTIEGAYDEYGDIDYEAASEVDAIAKKRDLGITSDRDIASIARDSEGNIIGGAYTSYDNTSGEYTFDVVVDERFDGKGVGSKLLNEVIEIPFEIEDMNPDAKVVVDVVNPQMQSMLEARGFEVIEKTGPNRVKMSPKLEVQESDVSPEVELNIEGIDNQIKELELKRTKLNEAEYQKDKRGEESYSKEFISNNDKLRDEVNRLKSLKEGKVPAFKQRQTVENELNNLNKPFEFEVGNKFYPRKGTVAKGVKVSDDENLGGIYETKVEGYLFRGVSLEDYNRIKDRGFVDTDLRGAISDKEGINLAQDASTAFNYLPEGVEGVVMAIKVSDKDGLFMIGADDYVRSSKPIPFSDVKFVTSPSIEGRYTLIKEGESTDITINETTQEVQESDVSPEVQAEVAAMEADERIDLSELNALYPKTPTEQAVAEEVTPTESVNSNIESIEEFYDGEIEDIKEEITLEQGNTKEGIAEIKSKIADVRKDKSLSKDDKFEAIEDFKQELEDFKEEQRDIISIYKDDIRVAKADMKADIKEAKKSTPNFRRKTINTLTESQNTENDIETANILEVFNQRADNVIDVSEITETENTPSQINVQALNERTGGNFQEFDINTLNDVPVMWNISDQLITGNYNPNITDVNENYSITNPLTGNEITNLKGGLGFSSVKGHENIAWASMTTDKILAQQKAAKEVYDKNPAKFDKLWADGTLPDGHIPMVIVKMGNDSMKSNEAMIRVISDNLESFPKKNKKAALKALKEQLKVVKKSYQEVINTGLTKKGKKAKPLTITNYLKFIGEIEDVQNMIKATEPKSIEDVLSTKNLKSLKGISSVVQITNLMTAGSFDVLKDDKEPLISKKPVIKSLYGESPSQKDINKFNIKKISDVITEPELADVPQRSAFMVTSIDIKNPETVRTSHPNYPVGPKGKVLGILKQPISIVDLVPAAYNNVALGIAQEISGQRQSRSDKARLVQTIPVQAGLANRELLGTPIGINTDKRFIDFLQRSFPDSNIIVDADTFNGVMQRDGVKEYLKDGDVIYGVTVDGKIFINPDVHKTSSDLFNTAIHEMGHVWTNYIQQTPKGKKLYNRGIELVKETDTYIEQLEIFNGDVIKAANEAMAILIGNKGESITNESIKSKWRDWLIGLWDYIKSQFKQFKDLTSKEIQDLNLDQFLGTALRDILGGKPIKLTPKQREAMKADANFRKISPSNKNAVEKAVKKLRDAGYSEVGIKELLDKQGVEADLIAESMAKVKKSPVKPKQKKAEKKTYDPQPYIIEARKAKFSDKRMMDYLVRRKGMKVKDAQELLDVNIDLLNKLPKSFGNITGGAKVGLKLFNKVQNFRDKLIARNNKLNKYTKENKISEGEIMDKTIEFLESQPEYKAEAETYKVKGEIKTRKELSTIQAQMITEFQKMNILRPTQAMRAKLETARRDIKQRAKGARDLKATQAILKSFIRKTIPASQYSKSDVVKLINAVSRADKASIDNLINEVFEFAVSKNVKTLQGNIKDILKIKTEEIYGGRLKGIKVDNETAKLIDLINKNILTEKSTATQIEEANEIERQKIEALSESPIENMSEIMARTSLIGINNSLLMENNDPSKVDALDTALENLDALVTKGKSELAILLEAQKNEYNRQFEIAFKEITGKDIDMSDPDVGKTLKKFSRDVDTKINKEQAKKALIKITKSIFELPTNFIYNAEAMQGLMDAISKTPGELFGGKLQELVTDKIDASNRTLKQRNLTNRAVIEDKLKEIYGKKWKNSVRDNRSKRFVIESIEGRSYTQDQLYYFYNQFKDPANHPTFGEMWGSEKINKKDSAEEKKRKNSINITEAKLVAAEMESKLTPEVKEFADWQVNEYFPSLYEYYNEIYKKIYRTDMPWNEFYAGMIYRDGPAAEPLNLIGQGNTNQTSVGGSSSKSRIENTTKIKDTNGTDALISYLSDMEFFAAYAENVRDIHKIFTNPIIKDAIVSDYGKSIYNTIIERIKLVASQGVKSDTDTKLLDYFNNVFVTTRVAVSPVIFVKQMTSAISYTADIGLVNYTKYAAKNIVDMRKIFKEIKENSVYMQDRGATDISRVLSSYSDSVTKEFTPSGTKEFFIDAMMFFVKSGDAGAIYLGGMPLYSYHKAEFKKKNPKATEQEAIDYAILKFEKATKTTQQSSDVQDKDTYQLKGAIARSMSAFQTSQKQYLRKEVMSIRNLYRKAKARDKTAGKGTINENIRQFAMFHMILPMFFQWVTSGFPGILSDWDEDDDQDMLRAMIIGNLNAFFIAGDIIQGVGDLVTGKSWFDEFGKNIGVIEMSRSIAKKVDRYNNTKDPEMKAAREKELYADLLTLLKIPAPQLLRMSKNIDKISSENIASEELILRLLNYSEYVIKNSKGKKSKTKPPTKAEEKKILGIELYNLLNNSEFNAQIKSEEYYEKQLMKKLDL